MKIIKISDDPSSFGNGGQWQTIIPEDKLGEFNAELLRFEKPSKLGIDGGRISKLLITNKQRDWLANYDRGWNVEPAEEIKDFYDEVIKQFN